MLVILAAPRSEQAADYPLHQGPGHVRSQAGQDRAMESGADLYPRQASAQEPGHILQAEEASVAALTEQPDLAPLPHSQEHSARYRQPGLGPDAGGPGRQQ